MFKVAHETVIRARPDTVYDVITDVASYAHWNPWNIRADGGPAVEGETIAVTVKMGKRKLTVKHKILVLKPRETFVWCDLGWFTWFAYGERAAHVQPDQQGARYKVELTVTGPLAWLAKLQFGKAIEKGVHAETDALKRLAEARG